MLTFRRRRTRKVARLARALALLDEQAGMARPASRRATRLSVGSARL